MRTPPTDLYSVTGALKTLRMPEHQSWETVVAICEIHFREEFPNLSAYLRIQNVTGMKTCFEAEAARLTRELPSQMMDQHRPITAVEAEEIAARILLLTETAAIAQFLIFPLSVTAHPATNVVVPIRRAA